MDGYIDQRFGCEKDDEGFEPGTMSFLILTENFQNFVFQFLIMIFNSSSR